MTWDPVGKYLASQSDDRSLRVWRTRDWQHETTITEPFEECGGTTHVLRLHWSPSGQFIVSAHAMNNTGPVAQIIERTGWTTAMDLVGHRKAVTVVRFNSNIYQKKRSEKKPQYYCCCAVGSRDRSLSIWLTAFKRPLVVIHDLFSNSVLDISWTPNGLQLLCCSLDGSVAFVDFDPQEVGNPLTDKEVQLLLEKYYGKSLWQSNQTTSRIIESTDVLVMQQKQQQQEKERQEKVEEAKRAQHMLHSNLSNSRLSMSSGGTPIKHGSSKQLETRTKDGRRRITPILLVPAVIEEQSGPLPFVSSQPVFSTSTELSKIEVEKSPLKVRLSKVSPSITSASKEAEKLSTLTPTAQKEGVNAAPASPLEAVGTSVGVSPIQSLSASRLKPPEEQKKPDAAKSSPVLGLSETKSADKKDKLKAGSGVKRKIELTTIGPDGTVIKKKDGRGRPRKDRTLMMHQQASPAHHHPLQPAPQREVSRVIYSTSHLSLPVLAVEKSTSKQISGAAGSDTGTVLEVENSVGTPNISTVHKVRCIKAGRTTLGQCSYIPSTDFSWQ